MILKTFEIEKISKTACSIFLLYGENEGFKNQIILKYFLEKNENIVHKYDEKEFIENYQDISSSFTNKSFFENNKIILISRATDKIVSIMKDLINNKFEDIIFIIKSGILDKRSKLRNLFEKENDVICIPFYSDDSRTLSSIASSHLRGSSISYSQESINLIIDRCNGDRELLKNELDKIKLFLGDRKKLKSEDVDRLTNLHENYSVSELIDNCLIRNSKRTTKILNENNFSSEDCILIIRTLLMKSKRILNLKENLDASKNIDTAISNYKPNIFWKDKPVVKLQMNKWNLENIKKLIIRINDIELLIKKNSNISKSLIYDFIINTSIDLSN